MCDLVTRRTLAKSILTSLKVKGKHVSSYETLGLLTILLVEKQSMLSTQTTTNLNIRAERLLLSTSLTLRFLRPKIRP